MRIDVNERRAIYVNSPAALVETTLPRFLIGDSRHDVVEIVTVRIGPLPVDERLKAAALPVLERLVRRP